uniref:Omega-theraphotoxin-Gr1a n=1 Tax=Grammostola rosea TaxID=432528 RepID=WGRTX_GRARO|nr:RecName: Full=Omega-theraphotoxin-Gr1a; Short=Omega-TRTX-Gr1a; AltName: Full=Omega-grammotoxin SIA; Short=Omega-GTX SIA; Short=Omega-GrTx SIA; Short=Omega-GsTx SIA; Flags: Precursor [Grammostola rosea]BAK55735.1 Omega-GrammotoxinSIA [Grammostola rosea]
MKAQIFVVVLGLAALSVLCYGSEADESALHEEIFQLLAASDEVPKPQERDCVRFWGKCSQTSDCCPHLACKSKWPRNICVWDGSVGK